MRALDDRLRQRLLADGVFREFIGAPSCARRPVERMAVSNGETGWNASRALDLTNLGTVCGAW
jgi:hypothetical protein